MPARVLSDSATKAVVSVSEMAKTCGLSRPHFHTLVKSGVMPQPVYCVHSRRPLFTRELQQMCLAVKQTNIGMDGRYVCFYSPRQRVVTDLPARQRRTPTPIPATSELLEGVRSLGLSSVTGDQVQAAVSVCYPSGTVGVDEGTVLRTVWQHLRRQI